ncbi:uncharacterized protein ACDP82_020217 isoform 7-T7 [Pangshura tecta]
MNVEFPGCLLLPAGHPLGRSSAACAGAGNTRIPILLAWLWVYSRHRSVLLYQTWTGHRVCFYRPQSFNALPDMAVVSFKKASMTGFPMTASMTGFPMTASMTGFPMTASMTGFPMTGAANEEIRKGVLQVKEEQIQGLKNNTILAITIPVSVGVILALVLPLVYYLKKKKKVVTNRREERVQNFYGRNNNPTEDQYTDNKGVAYSHGMGKEAPEPIYENVVLEDVPCSTRHSEQKCESAFPLYVNGQNEEIKFLDTLNDCFMELLVREPTRGEATLDLILSGVQELVQETCAGHERCRVLEDKRLSLAFSKIDFNV